MAFEPVKGKLPVYGVPLEEPKLENTEPTPVKIPWPTEEFTGGLTSPQRSQYKLEEFEDYFEGRIDPVYTDIVEERAKNQSTGEKWANATGKFAITAGTTYLDGTLGTAVGALEFLTGGSFINNSFSNAMSAIS